MSRPNILLATATTTFVLCRLFMRTKMDGAFQFIEHSLFTLLAAADPELHEHITAYVNPAN